MSKNLLVTTPEQHTCEKCGHFHSERRDAVNEGYRRDFEYVQKMSKHLSVHQGKLAVALAENRRLRQLNGELKETINELKIYCFDLERALEETEAQLSAVEFEEGGETVVVSSN